MSLELARETDQTLLDPIEDIIDDARNGRMFILVDDEDRENEGDLIIPAQMATPERINFMATHGRGLICLAMERSMVERLELPMMAARNTSGHGTAFTVSIEAKEGVSTGISAPDRAKTVQVAIDPSSKADAIAMPGHVFPLQAKDGGVLVRAGHTEAAVDLARMAGLQAAGVICEVMKDDGEMARLHDLRDFADQHGLKLGSIADLIAYRLKTERCVEMQGEEAIESRFGGAFTLRRYKNLLNGDENLALIKGTPDYSQPVKVRVHAVNVETDLLGLGENTLHKAMEKISQDGAGIVLLLTSTRDMAAEKTKQAEVEKDQALRHYGIGAQILKDIGVNQMTLLTNSPKHMVGLNGFGLDIVGQETI
jgi:3,4-dihydroxy 2-butanone 4-phosphate synthase/GTP cyclohydrolase II